jgi:hypothetical protein
LAHFPIFRSSFPLVPVNANCIIFRRCMERYLIVSSLDKR